MTPVVIGVDAHKRTHTLVAVDGLGRKLGHKTVATTTAAHHDAAQWARLQFGSDLIWGVEDCRSLTARLESDLLAEGFTVFRVPPHLMSRARESSRERGKSDAIDALAIARAVQRETNLPRAAYDPISMELRLLIDRREDLVDTRTGYINRLIVRVHLLDPARVTPANWNVKKARAEMRIWLASQHGLVAELARDELEDIVHLSESIELLTRRISERVHAVAPTLLTLPGCAEITAAKIVAEVANVNRFRSDAAFARYAGLAPTPHSSAGSSVRMRSVKHGNRQLNSALHRIAVTQIRMDSPGRAYFQKRLDGGDTRSRALRSLKRHLSRVVYHRLLATTDAVVQTQPATV